MTYLLTPWCRILLEQLTGLQLVKKFHAFHGTRRFITALTSVRHLSLSWASPVQSIYPHPTSWTSILILSTHLRLGLPSGSFPPVSPPRPWLKMWSRCVQTFQKPTSKLKILDARMRAWRHSIPGNHKFWATPTTHKRSGDLVLGICALLVHTFNIWRDKRIGEWYSFR